MLLPSSAPVRFLGYQQGLTFRSDFRAATKLGAIVGGQTSCKAPEMAAFEKYLPDDVRIVSCHSLHGPDVDSKGQPLVRPSRNLS